MEIVVCSQCGLPKSSKDYYLFAGRRNGRICKACVKVNVLKRKRARLGLPGPRELTCDHCQARFISSLRRARFCSARCNDLSRSTGEIEQRRQARHEAWNIRREGRACVYCGGAIPTALRLDAKFCSERCNSAAHNFTRKLEKRSGDELVLISRAAIAEGDAWRCQICRRRVDPKLRHPHPRSASIDHVIPLADGGDNSLPNLQLTHLRCNLSKRDRGVDQLRLI